MSEPLDPQRDEHGEWDALAVGWALSALDPEDSVLFAAHLPGCARCTATVRESLYTVTDLAYALPDEAPPAGMKSRLMAAVAAEPRTAPPAPDGQWPLGGPHPGTPGQDLDWFAKNQAAASTEPFPAVRPVQPAAPVPAQPRPPERDGPIRTVQQPLRGRHSAPEEVAFPDSDDSAVVIPFESRRRSRGRVVASAAAVAAVLAVIAALGAWNVNLRSQQNDLKSVAAQREATIQQLTANGPARVAALTADGKPSDARKATLVVRGNQVEIIVESIGVTPRDKTYWLWTLSCDNGVPKDPKPVSGFTVTQSAFSVRSIGSDAAAATATCFAISSETGTARPTTPHDLQAVGQPGT